MDTVRSIETSASYMQDNMIFIMPNGNSLPMALDYKGDDDYRSKNPEKRILNKDNFSRGVRYRIDTDKMEIE